jgi:hypothetical protein
MFVYHPGRETPNGLAFTIVVADRGYFNSPEILAGRYHCAEAGDRGDAERRPHARTAYGAVGKVVNASDVRSDVFDCLVMNLCFDGVREYLAWNEFERPPIAADR